MERYNFKIVEEKWQKYWEEKKLYTDDFKEIFCNKLDYIINLGSSKDSEYNLNTDTNFEQWDDTFYKIITDINNKRILEK